MEVAGRHGLRPWLADRAGVPRRPGRQVPPARPRADPRARRAAGPRPADRASRRVGCVMDVQHCDVVVVGARAAGAATAMLLAQAGLDVTVVDRSREGSDTLSTHALYAGRGHPAPPVGSARRHPGRGHPAGAPHDLPLLRCQRGRRHPPRRRDRRAVRARVAPCSIPCSPSEPRPLGADVRFGFTVTHLIRDEDGRVSGVVGTDWRGRPTTIRARVVVGADGLHSVVADQVGAPVERTGTRRRRLPVPLLGGRRDRRLRVGVPPARDGRGDPHQRRAHLRVRRDPRPTASPPGRETVYATLLEAASPSVASRVLAGRPEGRVRRFLGRPGLLRRPWGPGWVLVGDAGYWKDPISAHGITDALRDAELAAGAIVRAVGATDATEEDGPHA